MGAVLWKAFKSDLVRTDSEFTELQTILGTITVMFISTLINSVELDGNSYGYTSPYPFINSVGDQYLARDAATGCFIWICGYILLQHLKHM